MSLPQLEVESRADTGKGVARKLRATGMIPGVFYGPETDAVSLTINPAALAKLIKESPGRTFLLNLIVDGDLKKAMLKNVQIHPISRNILHADFYSVSSDRPITLEVFINYVGTPVGLKDGGVTEVRKRFVPLSGLPDLLPATVDVDITDLGVGDSFKVSQLKLEDGVEALLDPDMILSAVAAPQVVDLEEAEEGGEEGEEAEAQEGESKETETTGE